MVVGVVKSIRAYIELYLLLTVGAVGDRWEYELNSKVIVIDISHKNWIERSNVSPDLGLVTSSSEKSDPCQGHSRPPQTVVYSIDEGGTLQKERERKLLKNHAGEERFFVVFGVNVITGSLFFWVVWIPGASDVCLFKRSLSYLCPLRMEEFEMEIKRLEKKRFFFIFQWLLRLLLMCLPINNWISNLAKSLV